MALECYGEYKDPDGQCGECPLAFRCIDLAIKLDGYYDDLEQKEVEAWGSAADAMFAEVDRLMIFV